MYQGRQYFFLRQSSQVRTGLAELDPSEGNFADSKFPPDQMIQRDCTRDQIPAAPTTLEGDPIIPLKGFQGFDLDQRHLTPGIRFFG